MMYVYRCPKLPRNTATLAAENVLKNLIIFKFQSFLFISYCVYLWRSVLVNTLFLAVYIYGGPCNGRKKAMGMYQICEVDLMCFFATDKLKTRNYKIASSNMTYDR